MKINRRSLIKLLASLPAVTGISATRRAPAMEAGKGPRVAVIGAGAFGGWTALNLLRSGARVTLLDAWDAGNPLSSSGGESRVIRHAYASRTYVDLARRSLELWKEHNRLWGRTLFHPKGVLFMSQGGDFLREAQANMVAAGVDFEVLDAAELARKYPQINPEALKWGLLEPGAGYLSARVACGAVRDAFVAEGGDYRTAKVLPGPVEGGEMKGLSLEDGTAIEADRYVFACGPWMKELFPDLVGEHLRITRQEIYFFRTPRGQLGALNETLPVWADVGDRLWYGIPGTDGLFKIADDTRGPEVDPTTHSRAPDPSGIEAARRFMEFRFPGMAGAPFADARVCQYTETPDADFIVDRHPGAENAWLVGGGSGHGFKHGPALGEMVAAGVLADRPPGPPFGLERFSGSPGPAP